MDSRRALRGAGYLEDMGNARMALSISRPDNVYLYASDRMSQLLGNGLLTFVSRATGFQDLFADHATAFYDGLHELMDQHAFFARHDDPPTHTADAGWAAAPSNFPSHPLPPNPPH